MVIESISREGITKIVATEGTERTVRNVKTDVWMELFATYGMVETGFSESSLYLANLVVKDFACGNYCTLDRNGKSLMVGCKGLRFIPFRLGGSFEPITSFIDQLFQLQTLL